ncbi:MAG: PIN domain-containing protein [Thermodesulfobacteriota bacterium]|nr:PIN domain-containing protein [Thermodesulfobacteriota bacterium]
MIVFADTSGLFAFLVQDDNMHVRAKAVFQSFAEDNSQLLTSSYVLVETTALLQRRVGVDAVLEFHNKIQPLLDVIWVDDHWHEKAVNRLIALNQKKVSLVDCLSFIIMEAREISTAFSFDKHFEKNGFSLAE